VASANCLIVCIIGMRTAQFGFIPANLFCIGVYGFSVRSWIRDPKQLKPTGNSATAPIANQ
jgi:hypothetical protein